MQITSSVTSADYQSILDTITRDVQPFLGQGKVADYIPPLADADPAAFGMALVTLDGRVFQAGEARQRFSIQSISKLFALALSVSEVGEEIWQRVGREPSGTPFNSLVQLEVEQGRPRNPFINAGALVIADILTSRFVQPDIAVLQFIRRLACSPEADLDLKLARAEEKTAFRNIAMANLIKSFGKLVNPVEDVIHGYCGQCAIMMNCVELAHAAGFLINRGTSPWSGDRILSPDQTRRLNALMLTCGTYDAAGEFAYRVGLPAKSGVGGGILAVIPGILAICVWSPGLDASGNSLAGTIALERFAEMTGQTIF